MQVSIHSIYSFHRLGQRDNQEDARYPNADCPDPGAVAPFFVVCDGVGGCNKGEIASATVCEAIAYALSDRNWQQPFTDADFQRVLTEAYEALDRRSSADNIGMATTLTFLAFHAGGCMVAHIGDSRVYQIRPEEDIVFRTEDHSLVNEMLRLGIISDDEAKDHPQRNVITRCMNANDGSRQRDVASVVNITDIAAGDYFLLCSDGVTSIVDDQSLLEILSSDLPDNAKIHEIARCCKAADDNNTAILIHVDTVDRGDMTPVNDTFETAINHPRCVHEVEADAPRSHQHLLKSILHRIFPGIIDMP